MANPNLVNVQNIYGNTAVLTVSTTTANIVQNPISSSTLYKINSLIVTNVNTFSSAVGVTVQINQGGSTITNLSQNMVVPGTSSIVISGRDTPLYLLENTSIQLSAGSNNSVNAVVSYEQIS